MKAVILAGGLGTRLSEETHLNPKPMVEVGGKPILWHILKIYNHFGINEFIICCGYKGYLIKKYFANYFLHTSDVTFHMDADNRMDVHQRKSEPWKVTLVDTGDLSQTGGRLARVRPYLNGCSFCFTYDDGVADVDIGALIAHHQREGKQVTLTAVQPPGRYGALHLDGNAVVQFQEKPDGDNAWINEGFFVVAPSVLDLIENAGSSWEADVLPQLAAAGQPQCFSTPGLLAADGYAPRPHPAGGALGQPSGPLEALVMLELSFWRGRRVLITGHTGFKGSWLTLWLLCLGAEVWGYALAPEPGRSLFKELPLDQPSGFADWGKLHHHSGDVRALEALQQVVEEAQPEVVLHLAAQPLVRCSYRDPLGTWATNVLGSLHLLEALKALKHHCAVVMVTTDKVYANQEWDYGYREEDRLGGHDPYSASKAAAELAIASWRASFCGLGTHQTPHLSIATARAGNVISGGDWAEDRIVPDAMRSLAAGEPIPVRRPEATRPWQHVLEPLGGYMLLAEKLAMSASTGLVHAYASAFNFGPAQEANRSVRELVEAALAYWPGSWRDLSDPMAPHEAGRLHLQFDKAHHQFGWRPSWPFATTVERTVAWYRAVHEGASPLERCLWDLQIYHEACADAR